MRTDMERNETMGDQQVLEEAKRERGTMNARTRLTHWAQKMLDFSARNRLLNIPAKSRQVVRLNCDDVAVLENWVSVDKGVPVLSLTDAAEAVEMRRRLTGLLHDARTGLEESGVNTLFLTIGELQWLEPGTGEGRKSYRAPIVMVPVRFERASLAEGVKMYRRDEDAIVNTTLVEFLRTQFNVSVTGIDPLPADDSGVDVARVLDLFREAIKDRDGWSVLAEATVGIYSFGKFVMWKDLTERAEALERNPLVGHLIGGGGLFDDGVAVFPAEEVAKHLNPTELFCPVSYDSSQLAAVLYSALGKSFVLHGPPGTGKSQTITNIIAHNLALGRRVLFVSEKKAALDVVKNRLDRIGLTPFCLELHSNKTEKGRFYAQLKEALEVPECAAPEEWTRVVADFETCREELNAYVAELHRPYPNGLTPYACFARVIQSGSKEPQDLFAFDCLVQSAADYARARQAVLDLTGTFRDVAEGALAALPEMRAADWTPALERQVGTETRALAAGASQLAEPLKAAMTAFGWDGPPTFTRARTVQALQAKFIERQELAAALPAYDLKAIDSVDLDGVARRLEENAQMFFVSRFFRNRALVRELAGVVRPGAGKLTVGKLADDLPHLQEYKGIERDIVRLSGLQPDDCRTRMETARTAVEGVLGQLPGYSAQVEKTAAVVAAADIPDDLAWLVDWAERIQENLGELRRVLRYRQALAAARASGVGAFADYLRDNDDGAVDMGKAYDDAYAAKMLDGILASSKVLAGFTGLGREERIARFRSLNDRYAELSKGVIYARLAATLPRRRSGPCPVGTELGLVKRECEKKTRQKAVRTLLAEAQGLVSTLKPCFLMSPLSVAQYLPVDSAPFDLIVFDEASQIPVWDAIGVIARGKQLVVVGDPKQMPPTNFFQKGEVEDEDAVEEELIADQESILDECLVAGVFSTYLKWHYRSRHESLIAFSNAHYYENKLCTFPSASDSPRLGVKFRFVENGRFAKQGRGPRVNEVEAKALVDYVCETVLKPDYRRRSIGIVTFSLPQQKLIQTMLEDRRGADPNLERLLPDEGEGAYFVKNLENVQGDESDVILFSVGYAPDENGRFTMNFGPLNLSGGERRLNVAVTRAKEQVVVFSSIRGSQIDAGEGGRTQAVGAGHLKAFLEYAERGVSARCVPTDAEGTGLFGDTVAEFLRAKGFTVDRDVGCSDYRIDVAIRHPDDPSRYLMGLECDGPVYAGQRTAQDRDVNRDGVLKGLGWKTGKVWSVDWALDRARAEAHLLELIEAARAGERTVGAPSAGAAAGTPVPVSVPVVVPTGRGPLKHPEYKVWKGRPIANSARFYEPASQARIEKMLMEVVEKEGPVYEALARKRVARAWGLTRITDRVQGVFGRCLNLSCLVSEHPTGRVYWPQGVKPADYTDYRVPSKDPDGTRAVDEIPPEELRNAMREIDADLGGGCPQETLYRETVKVFGLASVTAKARACLGIAFKNWTSHE